MKIKGNGDSSDLDLFNLGGSDEGASDAGADIFNLESKKEAAGQAPEGDVKAPEEKPADQAVPANGGEPEKKDGAAAPDEAKKPEDAKPSDDLQLDPELAKLFDAVEDRAESKADPKMVDLVNQLRVKLAEKESDILVEREQVKRLQEKLLKSAGDEADSFQYKGLASTVESSPKLAAVVKLWSRKDDEKAGSRLKEALADVFEEVTGIDVSKMLRSAEEDKILAATGSRTKSAVSEPSKDEKEDKMDYDRSVDDIFNIK